MDIMQKLASAEHEQNLRGWENERERGQIQIFPPVVLSE